ncbi:MAG TPA: hypothetical protein VJY41_03140 [Prolixibacteraceae bacterium]|nr:hypothetical protein [Prolixibacteraceae bacterium]
MQNNYLGVREPDILNAKTFEYKERETYYERLAKQRVQHEIVAEYFHNLGFIVKSQNKETIALLEHDVYGDVEVFFFFSEEPIGTWKKLLIKQNGHKSSRQLIKNIIRTKKWDYSLWFDRLGFSA